MKYGGSDRWACFDLSNGTGLSLIWVFKSEDEAWEKFLVHQDKRDYTRLSKPFELPDLVYKNYESVGGIDPRYHRLIK